MRRIGILVAATALAVALLVPVALARDGRGSEDDDDRDRHKGRVAVVVAVDQAARTITLRTARRLAGSVRVGDHVLLQGRALLHTNDGNRRRLDGDDEVEVTGTLVSLAPVVVRTAAGAIVGCVVPPGRSLAGVSLGSTVEVTCDLIRGTWLLRKIHAEDGDDRDDSGSSGHGGGGGDD